MRLLTLAVLLLAATFCEAEQLRFSGGSVVELPDGTQLAFDLDGPAEMESFILNNPPRFVIDIKNARFDDTRLLAGLRSHDVQAIRTGVRDGRNLRIVLDLASFVRSKSSIVQRNGHHLVIDIFRNEPLQPEAELVTVTHHPAPTLQLISPATYQVPAEPELRPAVLQKPVLKIVEEPPLPQAKEAPKAKESKEKAALAVTPAPPVSKPSPQARPVRRDDLVIVIDPGHGGKDPGAIGAKGTEEKNVTLQIARRLKKLIDQEPGMRAVLTRDSDTYLHLYQRVSIARKHQADLFISIHADAVPDNIRAHGSSVYMLSTKGASSAAARFLAERENGSDAIEGALAVSDKALQPVVFDMVHDAVRADSMELAGKILSQLGKVNGLHKRRVEQANFAVLKAPEVPSILVETAFISNPKEEANLSSGAHQQKLAQAILNGIRAYFGQRPQQMQAPTQRVAAQAVSGQRMHVVQRGESLSSIARRYQVSLSQLRSANGIGSKQQQINAGIALVIPTADS